jgi:hypothetical protein
MASNEQGQGLEEIVFAEQRLRAKKNQYIRAEFWLKLAKDFKLEDTTFPSLLRPSPDEFPPEEGYHDLKLIAIMERVTSEQICVRHRALEKLQQHLTTCKEFNMPQTYALVSASQESPLVSAQASYKIQFGILRYFARFGIHRKWPQGWDVIKHRLEDVFMNKWLQMAATGVSRQMFLSVFSKELDLFVDSNNVKAIETSVSNNVEPLALAWEDVVSSKLGLTLYAVEASLASWKDHIS